MLKTVNNPIGADLMEEAAAWREQVFRWLGSFAKLVHVSAHSNDVRLYRAGERVLKLRRLTPAAIRGRPNTLQDEYEALQRVAAANMDAYWQFPRALRYHYENGWEGLELTAVEPAPAFDPVLHPFREKGAAFWRLARGVARLNMAGLSHGDLTPANVGFNSNGAAVMLDFDQCVAAHPARCLLRDFFGVACADQPAKYTLWNRAGRVSGWSCLRWSERIRERLRRRRRGYSPPVAALAQQAEMRGDSELAALTRCWAAAAESDANSPGSGVAYYSLDLRGFHLPGERPWPLRWEMLHSAVSFRDKRVVELGCNLGLLAIHARLSGASSAVAVDHNLAIVEAGRILAGLCGVGVEFGQVDFDKDADWEQRLGGGDLVTALSLTFWLQDKDRVWRYLGRFPEVIFEGHEPVEEVEERLRTMGFLHVVQIGRSERNRVVFHARKD